MNGSVHKVETGERNHRVAMAIVAVASGLVMLGSLTAWHGA